MYPRQVEEVAHETCGRARRLPAKVRELLQRYAMGQLDEVAPDRTRLWG